MISLPRSNNYKNESYLNSSSFNDSYRTYSNPHILNSQTKTELYSQEIDKRIFQCEQMSYSQQLEIDKLYAFFNQIYESKFADLQDFCDDTAAKLNMEFSGKNIKGTKSILAQCNNFEDDFNEYIQLFDESERILEQRKLKMFNNQNAEYDNIQDSIKSFSQKLNMLESSISSIQNKINLKQSTRKAYQQMFEQDQKNLFQKQNEIQTKIQKLLSSSESLEKSLLNKKLKLDSESTINIRKVKREIDSKIEQFRKSYLKTNQVINPTTVKQKFINIQCTLEDMTDEYKERFGLLQQAFKRYTSFGRCPTSNPMKDPMIIDEFKDYLEQINDIEKDWNYTMENAGKTNISIKKAVNEVIELIRGDIGILNRIECAQKRVNYIQDLLAKNQYDYLKMSSNYITGQLSRYEERLLNCENNLCKFDGIKPSSQLLSETITSNNLDSNASLSLPPTSVSFSTFGNSFSSIHRNNQSGTSKLYNEQSNLTSNDEYDDPTPLALSSLATPEQRRTFSDYDGLPVHRHKRHHLHKELSDNSEEETNQSFTSKRNHNSNSIDDSNVIKSKPKTIIISSSTPVVIDLQKEREKHKMSKEISESSPPNNSPQISNNSQQSSHHSSSTGQIHHRSHRVRQAELSDPNNPNSHHRSEASSENPDLSPTNITEENNTATTRHHHHHSTTSRNNMSAQEPNSTNQSTYIEISPNNTVSSSQKPTTALQMKGESELPPNPSIQSFPIPQTQPISQGNLNFLTSSRIRTPVSMYDKTHHSRHHTITEVDENGNTLRTTTTQSKTGKTQYHPKLESIIPIKLQPDQNARIVRSGNDRFIVFDDPRPMIDPYLMQESTLPPPTQNVQSQQPTGLSQTTQTLAELTLLMKMLDDRREKNEPPREERMKVKKMVRTITHKPGEEPTSNHHHHHKQSSNSNMLNQMMMNSMMMNSMMMNPMMMNPQMQSYAQPQQISQSPTVSQKNNQEIQPQNPQPPQTPQPPPIPVQQPPETKPKPKPLPLANDDDFIELNPYGSGPSKNQPTNNPKVQSTAQQTTQPTVQQNRQPTVQQNRQPTVQQTRQPTVQQNRQPTVQQNRQPTVQQNRQPTAQQARQQTAVNQ